MKKILCLLSVFVLFSCSHEDNDKGLQTPENQISSAGDGQYDLLGYGYDIKGEYADPSAGRSLVFDITRIKNYEPFRIEKSLFNKQTAELVSGGSMHEYTEELSAKFKIKGSGFFNLFKASVYVNFDGTSTDKSNYSFASYFYNIEKSKLALMLPTRDYNNYLTLNFKEDVIRLTPEEIVQFYGTHALMDITLGARLSIHYRGLSSSSSSSKKTNAGANVKFSASKLFGLDTSLSGSVNNSQSNSFSDQRLTYKTIGGAPSSILSSFINLSNINDILTFPSINVDPWVNSINNSTTTLIKINENGLVPIYELINNDAKAKAVKDYVLTGQYEPFSHGYAPTQGGGVNLEPGLMFIDYCTVLFDGKYNILMYTEHDGFMKIASYEPGSNVDFSQLSTMFDIKNNIPVMQQCPSSVLSLDPTKTSVKINTENNKKYLIYVDGWDKRAYLINNNAILEKYSFKKNITIGSIPNLNDYKVSIL
jgi:hypothetical protein